MNLSPGKDTGDAKDAQVVEVRTRWTSTSALRRLPRGVGYRAVPLQHQRFFVAELFLFLSSRFEKKKKKIKKYS